MKQLFFTVIIILATTATLSAQYTVETVPNPNTDGWFVANPDDIISQNDVDELNSIIETAHNTDAVQVAVVALNSIGEKVPKEFANELFNYWGVGDASTNNGLLILLVLDQRTVSFETGYGIEESLTDLECYDIQQEFMIPYFKENKYGLGLIEGTKAAIEEASGGNPVAKKLEAKEAEMDEGAAILLYGFLIIYGLIIFIMLVSFVKVMIKVGKEKDLHKNYKSMKRFANVGVAIFFPLPFLFIAIYSFLKLKKLRNTPRISASGKTMIKLDEEADDLYLEPGKIIEEQVKSVDYDVWITEDGDEVLILEYKKRSSKYSKCPECNYITYYLEYDKTIKRATTSGSGTGEKKYSCKHCRHSDIKTYTIPQKTSSSSGSYSSSSSSWSSYSSGGSSWGGGSSGGGGASSSW